MHLAHFPTSLERMEPLSAELGNPDRFIFVKSNALCIIGHADEIALFQRLPCFDFDDVCEVI